MTDLTDFFSHAWQTIGRAIAEAGLKAGLREVPETVSKTVKRRCLGELKRLGTLLRRLIFLMAMHVQLAPVKPRLGSNYFEKSEGDAQSKYTCSLVPTKAGKAPDFLHGPIIVPMRGPVLAPLIDRWQAMLEALQGAERRAKCLARTLQRQKAAGEPKPYIVPIAKTHAMHRAVALISGGLTVQLIEALKAWPDPDTSRPHHQPGTCRNAEAFPGERAGSIAARRTCRLSGRPSACAVPAGGAGPRNRLRGRRCRSRRAGRPTRSWCGFVRRPAA